MDELDKYLLAIAKIAATRSNCSRRHFGSVLVDRRRCVISIGYNHTPLNILPCNQGGCPRCNDPLVPAGQGYSECYCVHAEVATILEAARRGIETNGSTLYVTGGAPCTYCLKELLDAGISEVVGERWDRTNSYPQSDILQRAIKISMLEEEPSGSL